MKYLIFSLFLISLPILTASCSKQVTTAQGGGASKESVEKGDQGEHDEAKGPSPVAYDKSIGLRLMPETEKAIGLRTQEVSEPVRLPQSALLSTFTGDFVYTESDGRYLRQAVVKGARYPGGWEIVDGLFAGDRVVVEPAWWLYLIELQAVRGGSHSH